MDNKFKVFVIVAILILGVGIAASSFFVVKLVTNQNTQTSASGQTNEALLTEVEVGDAITTNVSGDEEDSQQHIAKIEINLGVDASNKKAYKAFEKAMTSRSAAIRNEIISAVGAQTFQMLSAHDGREKLGDEIVTRLNKLLDTEIIHKVYYKEYYVQ